MKFLYLVRPHYTFEHPELDQDLDLESLVVAHSPEEALKLWCLEHSAVWHVSINPGKPVHTTAANFDLGSDPMVVLQDISLDLMETGSQLKLGVQDWSDHMPLFYTVDFTEAV